MSQIARHISQLPPICRNLYTVIDPQLPCEPFFDLDVDFQSKYRVKEEDCDILHKVIHRRWQDPDRKNFKKAEYSKAKTQIYDHNRFTRRHLTR